MNSCHLGIDTFVPFYLVGGHCEDRLLARIGAGLCIDRHHSVVEAVVTQPLV